MKKIEIFLMRYGADNLEDLVIYRKPQYFIFSSGICACIGMFIGAGWNPAMAFICLVLCAFLPAAILYVSNEQDNDAILKDLKWLYETISVQLESGLHIRQALLESEDMIKNRRLRKAMKTLGEGLVNGEELNKTLDVFGNSFNNHYVDSFCLILRQMQDSGYAVKLLGDVRLQLEEMEKVQLNKKKESLEIQLQIFQILLFMGIIVVITYGCILAAVQNINF